MEAKAFLFLKVNKMQSLEHGDNVQSQTVS
jgi:hypothetical protein